MSVSSQQIAQALQNIEDQLMIIKQALAEKGLAQTSEGVIGIFDGEFMVEDNGKRHQVPPNYASKSMLVTGDTVKMAVDAETGQSKFKQIAKVERLKAEGILVKKDGKFEVLTDAGSFKVLPAAIKHYNGEVGDKVKIQYPKNAHKGSWAAVVKVESAADQPSVVDGPVLQPIISPVTESVPADTNSNGIADGGQPITASAVNSDSGSDSKPSEPVKTQPKPKAPSAKQHKEGSSSTPVKSAPKRQQQPSAEIKADQAPPANPIPPAEVQLDEDDLV